MSINLEKIDTESAKVDRNFNGSMIKTALYSKPDIEQFNGNNGSYTVTKFLSTKKLGMYRNDWIWNNAQNPDSKKKSRSLSTSMAGCRVGINAQKGKEGDGQGRVKNLKRLLPYLKLDDAKIPPYVFPCTKKGLVKA